MCRRNLIPVWVGILALSGMFLMGQSADCPWTEGVSFPDANLELVIRATIGKPSGPICASDLEGMTYLNAVNGGITNLTGLEYCTGLTTLYLYYNRISDISPLAGLTGLSWLDLHDNQISDISPLAGLTGLSWLDLHDNQISDLGPLAGLTALKELYLYYNQVSDLSPLAGLTGLSNLDLGENQISDIYPLVQNYGIDSGDDVDLRNNPLDATSCTVYIPQLQSRFVIVWDDCP